MSSFVKSTQHGFRPGRSCLFAMLDVFDNIMHMLDSNSSLDMVYLAISLVFDKVDHDIILHKIRVVVITWNIGIWSFHFPTDIPHFIWLPCGLSECHPLLTGVPQGTILLPLLFLIMISDIEKNVSTSKPISLASDTILYSGVGNVTHCDNLNVVYNWASSNNMFFKQTTKFSCVCFSSNVSAYKSNVYYWPCDEHKWPLHSCAWLMCFHVQQLYVRFHISNQYKQCSNLAGWLPRTFIMRDPQVMTLLRISVVVTLFIETCLSNRKGPKSFHQTYHRNALPFLQ